MSVNENFFAWLERLRSGQVEQGGGKLHTISATGIAYMCCLGVCSAMFAEVLNTPVEINARGTVNYDSRAHYPDADVFAYMGIPESHWVKRSTGWSINVTKPIDGRLVNLKDYKEETLIGVDLLNDNGYNFEEIADFLQKEFAPETIGV